jgi:glycosyltransferase involved in cell wall biosynthesis
MRVLSYLHPSRCVQPCGGVGRHANELVSRLAHRSGYEVELFVSARQVGSITRERFPLADLPIRTHPLPELFAERLWKTVGWPSADRWVKGYDWVYSPMETYLPIKSVPVAVTIHDIQCFEPDLPWSHTAEHKARRAKWGVWVKKALRDCRFVCTVSEFTKQRMVELLDADPAKIIVTGNGVDERFFDLAASGKGLVASSKKLEAAPYVLVVGGLRYKKGADYVLAVARKLKADGNPLRIAVAGQNETAFLNQANQCGNVDVLGMVDDEFLIRRLLGAQALLFLSPYEGFGIPALEAMAAQVPVIAANRASLPEIVGDAGILVDPFDADNVVQQIQRLKDNQAWRAVLIRKGVTRARQFTWDNCVDALCNAFVNYD